MASVLRSFKVNHPAAAPTAADGISAYLANASNAGIASSYPEFDAKPSLASKISPYLSYLSLPSLKGASNTQTIFTVLAIIATFLVLEQVRYRHKKRGLPGPKWTIPIIGKFADSLHPTLEKYQAGWNSGPLSVASVFHM